MSLTKEELEKIIPKNGPPIEQVYKYIKIRLVFEDRNSIQYINNKIEALCDFRKLASSFSYVGKISNYYCFKIIIEHSDSIHVLVDDDGYIVAII